MRKSRTISEWSVRPDLLVAAVACLLMIATVTADAATARSFRAACVKVDITPDTPQWLQGYGPRQSEGVHDRIYHRIAAMDDGVTTFFLVSTDICTISPRFYDAFCKRLEQETAIKPAQVWWSTTHTHSAPHVGPQDLGRLFSGTLGDRFSIKHDTAYWAWVTDVLVKGIQEAQSRLEPGASGNRIRHGPSQCEPPRTQSRRPDRLGSQPRRGRGPPTRPAAAGTNRRHAHRFDCQLRHPRDCFGREEPSD